MIGMDRNTGKFLSGSEHLEQSLQILFTTSEGERVMRRFLGVDPALIDLPAIAESVGSYAYAMAKALDEAKETRFSLKQVNLYSVDRQGHVVVRFEGQNLDDDSVLNTFVSFV